MTAPEAWHVTRTMRSLELLAVQPRSAIEVASALGVHPRTARRLLNRLIVEGYVARAGSGRREYALTLKLLSVGEYAFEPTQLVREALPFVRELRAASGLTARLSVPSYRSALPLVSDEGAYLGRRVPCHACAAGKALLAYRPAWCEAVLTYPLEPHTGLTAISRAELLDDLERIRERGYAVEREELLAGVGGIAAPVADHTGTVIAALGVEGPATAVDGGGDQLGALIKAAAAELSVVLGHHRGDPQPGSPQHASPELVAMVPAARSYAA